MNVATATALRPLVTRPSTLVVAALLALAGSLTIEDLLKRAAKAGLRKPVTDPLNFVI